MSQDVLNPQLNLLRHDLDLTRNITGADCRETDESIDIPGRTQGCAITAVHMGDGWSMSSLLLKKKKKGNSYFCQKSNFGGKALF